VSTFNAGAIEASLTLDRSSWNRDLAEIEAKFEELEQKTITITIDADTDNFFVQSDNVELFADELDHKTVTVVVDMDSEKFHQAAAQVEVVTDAMSANDINIGVDMDSTAFHAGAAQVELVTDAIGKMQPTVNVDMDSTAFHAAAAQVELVVDAMSANDINIDVETSGVPETLAALAELEVATEIVDGNDIHIGVNYDRNTMERLVGGAAGGGGGGSMGLLKILIIAIIVLAPVLTVAIGALSAAIVGFTAALFAALGPLALLGLLIYESISLFKKADPKNYTKGMQTLRDALTDLSNVMHHLVDGDVGETVFKAMAIGIEIAVSVLKAIKPLLDDVANLFLDVAHNVQQFVKSPEFARWLDFFGGFGLDMLKLFLGIIANLVRFLFNLFIAIRPFARRLMKGLSDDLNDLNNWSKNLGKNKGFQDWVKNALYYGPLLLDLLGDIFGAFFHIGDAIRPFAEPMIKGLDLIADAIQRIPTDTLTQLILAGVAIFAAWKIVIPLFGALSTAADAIGAAFAADAIAFGLPLLPLLAIIAAVVAVAAMFIYLYETNENLRKQITESWNQIKATVTPIISDIVDVIKEHWGSIVKWAQDNWNDIKDIFLSAATIIHQLIFFLMLTITYLWQHYGDIILKIVVGLAKGLGQTIRGIVQVVSGVMRLIADILTGKWSKIGGDLRQIIRGIWNIIGGIFHTAMTVLTGILSLLGRTLANIWHGMWTLIRNATSAAFGWIQDQFHNFIGWLGGIGAAVGHAVAGMWDGLVGGFRDAINTIIGFWNNLSFSIPGFNPPGPGSFPGFTIGTPNLNYMAKGAYVTDPTLAVVGEGGEPEIVSPESKMKEIVSKFAGGHIDYQRMTDALMQALRPILGSVLTPELLDSILSKAGVTIPVHAENDDRSVNALVRALGFQMRVLGYAGATP
jgi:phage-related protein